MENRKSNEVGNDKGKKRDYTRMRSESPEPKNETPAKKSGIKSYYDSLVDTVKSNDKKIQGAELEATRGKIMNVGKEETHNELVVKPAKEFLKDDYSQVEAMNKAFKPISNVYMSKLELLNETTDGKEAKEFEPFRSTRERTTGVKRYDEKN